MTYEIYEEFLEDVKKKLNRIAKKCRKHGNDFVYNEIGTIVKEVKDDFGRKRFYKFVVVEVCGTAKIDDWEFIATIEIHENGNIIRSYNTEIEIPERFKTTGNLCEHCNSKRFRNNLYIVHNIKTDEWKQVGKTCLNLYTNGLNAEYVTAYMDGITELEERNGHFGIHGEAMFDIKEIIKYATVFVDKIGYFNSNADLPTKTLVGSMMLGENFGSALKHVNRMLYDYNVTFCTEDFSKKSTDDKVEKIIEYYNSIDDDSLFMHNVKSMIADGCCRIKNIGYLSYLPAGYNRFIEKQKERESIKEVDGHFGNIGERFKNLKVRYIRTLASFETAWGYSYFCKIVTEDDRVFYWSGKGVEEQMRIDGEWVDCVPNTISFTIKEHGEYNGTPQTKVTRCNIKYKKARD